MRMMGKEKKKRREREQNDACPISLEAEAAPW